MRVTLVTITYASEQRLDDLFDAKYGFGQVPNNQEIRYKGFTIYMKPDEFLELAKPTDTEKNHQFYVDAIKNGKRMGYPFFQVELDKDYRDNPAWRVTAHEGRHRASAVKAVYGRNVLIPVHIWGHNFRNRSLTEEMLSQPFIPEGGAGVRTTLFSRHVVDKDSKNLYIGSNPQSTG